MSYRTALALSILALLLLDPSSAPAWNDTGHRLAAVIAFDRLSPQKRQKVVALLKAHPRYAQDFAGPVPYKLDETGGVPLDRWIFSQAATWPDIARTFQGEDRARFHRSPWHYINIPYFLNSQEKAALEGKVPPNLKRDWTPDMMTEQDLNVVQTLKRCEYILTSPQSTPEDRAVHLCWLFHTVGDLHQPLHSTALFTSKRFMAGDRGGNDILVKESRNLHAYWDDLPGESESIFILEHVASDLMKSPLKGVGESSAGSLTYETWLQESHALAWQYAYDSTILAEVARKEGSDQKLDPVDLTDAYEAAAHDVATRRLVEAGFRLAALLDRWIK